MSYKILQLILLCLLASFCGNAQNKKADAEYDWDAKLKDMGLVDVTFWEPTIQCYLVYRTKDNFVGYPLYNSHLTRPWLHPRAAKMLIHAQELLQIEHPELSLMILDAARPMEVQRSISDWAKKTKNDHYVADANKGGGLHNYGMAVDLTLVDDRGTWLPMGTPYDFFGPEAHTDDEEELLKSSRITSEELHNRRLLRRIMVKVGFRTISSEWWHFNACSRDEARSKCKLIER